MWIVFSCACWLSVCFLLRNVCLSLLPMCLIGLFVFFAVELCKLFVYFAYSALVGYIICRYFLPLYRLSFHFLVVSFAVQKHVRLIRSHVFIFACISIALGDSPKKIVEWFMSENALSFIMYVILCFISFPIFKKGIILIIVFITRCPGGIWKRQQVLALLNPQELAAH